MLIDTKKGCSTNSLLILSLPACYFFFSSDRTNSNTTAPTVAQIKLPIMPPPDSPKRLKIQPPRKPPTTPTSKLIQRPKPFPFIICPAKYPAAIPIKINKMKLIAFFFRLNNKYILEKNGR